MNYIKHLDELQKMFHKIGYNLAKAEAEGKKTISQKELRTDHDHSEDCGECPLNREDEQI